MKYIVGISGYFHDSSVCLATDNSLIEFIKEETLTRVKGTNEFPYRSLRLLRDRYNLTSQNIQFVCFYEKPLRGWSSTIGFSFKRPIDRMELLKNQLKQFWSGPTHVISDILKTLEIKEDKVIFAPHHVSHVLSVTPFQPPRLSNELGLHFVFDAVGDGLCHSIFKGKPSELEIMHQNEYPHSLGLFYSAITEYCGFSVNEGEYKLMALAAYGRPIHTQTFFDEIIEFNPPSIKLNLDWFDFHRSITKTYGDLFEERFGSPATHNDIKKGSEKFQWFADVASSAQMVTETIINETISWAMDEACLHNVTVSGGVAQNCVAMRSASFIKNLESFTVPPSPGDSGAAIGAANFASIIYNEKPIRISKIAFGRPFRGPKVNVFNDLFEKIDSPNFYQAAASLIDEGEIICTYISGNEIGPRALGHRSMICSGSKAKVIHKLNTLIKKRESFRPLAPVMNLKIAEKYFHLNKKNIHNYTWMGLTAIAKENFPDRYTSCLHIDRSARLQIVEQKMSPLSKILNFVSDEILLNTSFNVSGDPIVGDYLDCFVNMKRMDLQFLITEDGLYKRKKTTQ